MLKKLTEGLLFGGGFAISFIALWYAAAYLISPMLISAQLETANKQLFGTGATIQSSISHSAEILHEPAIPFHELALEEQIKQSSVIALAKFEASTDGKMKAVIKEFLKKESGVTFHYKVGDEHPSSSYYPKENNSYGDGLVIFFTGSPATMKMSMSYSGDRLHGLGDLPLELLRKKCREKNA